MVNELLVLVGLGVLACLSTWVRPWERWGKVGSALLDLALTILPVTILAIWFVR